MVMRLALCTKMLQDYEMQEAVNIAADIGYEGLEIFGVPKHLPDDVSNDKVEALAAQLSKLGMEVVTLCTYVGMFSQKSDDECLQEVEKFRRYLDIAEALECDMIIENNFGLSATVDSTLEMIARVDRPNFGISYDPGNLYRMAEYHGPEALARFGELTWNVQVKDCYKDDQVDDHQRLLGEGVVDYELIVAWLADAEYDGYLSAECHREPDEEMTAEDIARHEYEAMKKLIQNV